ncbi:MAG: hypothetical protein NXH75_16775 [Halobacteriovoraceae bacterium]|nr:hypothetical protein [Halobacteriovoraceae bacterium]
MKNILITFLILFSTFASADEVADLYHERMEQRYQTVNFESFTAIAGDDVPLQVQELQQRQLDDMLHFATAYDLFSIGWSYQNSPEVYEVKLDTGETIAYTFSVIISKNGQPTGRRFYQASKRVDGVFFVERVSDYEL